MKKWNFTFEANACKIHLSSGSEAIFNADFCQIYDATEKNKFIISIADHRVSKKATCAIKCFGNVKMSCGKFCHFSDGDKFELLGQNFTVRVAFTALKRKFSSVISGTSEEIDIPEVFPIGWSEPGDYLMYYRPEDSSRFKSNKVAMFDVDWTIIKTKRQLKHNFYSNKHNFSPETSTLFNPPIKVIL